MRSGRWYYAPYSDDAPYCLPLSCKKLHTFNEQFPRKCPKTPTFYTWPPLIPKLRFFQNSSPDTFYNVLIPNFMFAVCLFRPLSSTKRNRGARKYPLSWQWCEWVEVNVMSPTHSRKSFNETGATMIITWSTIVRLLSDWMEGSKDSLREDSVVEIWN